MEKKSRGDGLRYILGPFDFWNRSRRRENAARFKGRGRTRAPHKKHRAKPHEARRLYCRPARQFPLAWH
jgi:hypothetical protein